MPLLTLLVTLVVLFGPGAVIARAAGLTPGTAVAVGPLISYGLATATGTLASAVEVPWRPWLLALETVVLAGALALHRRRTHESPRTHGSRGARTAAAAAARWWTGSRGLVALGVLTGGLVSAVVTVVGMGGLSRPNQDWDYTYHANATRLIADTGDVAPSALKAINNWDSATFFYPNGYHALAALVRDLTGAPVFTVLNAQTLLLGLLAGLGLAALLRGLRAPTLVTALSPVLLAGFAAFPYDLVWRGPVLPYATGLALVPASLVLFRTLLAHRSAGTVLLAALGAAGLLGLQPSTAVSTAVLVLALLVQRWASRRRIGLRDVAALAATGVLTVVLAWPEVYGSVRTGTGGPDQDWPAVASPARATWQLLLVNQGSPHQHVVLAVLVVVGLLGVPRLRRLWWWLAGTALAAVLFVLAAASDGELAQALTRPWWNDSYRLAAWTALGAAPLAAYGVRQLALLAGTAAGRLRARSATRQEAVQEGMSRPGGWRPAVPLVLVLAVVASGGLYTWRNGDAVSTAYRSQRYLDTAEVDAMGWLAQRVRPGETVMNDPGDGSAYMSALDGIRPLFGHQVPTAAYATMGPRQRALLDRFNCLDTDPGVRRLVVDLRIRYVFLGSGFVRPHMKRLAGLRGVDASPSLTLVHEGGGVRIYRVDLQPVAGTPLPSCATAGAGAEPPS